MRNELRDLYNQLELEGCGHGHDWGVLGLGLQTRCKRNRTIPDVPDSTKPCTGQHRITPDVQDRTNSQIRKLRIPQSIAVGSDVSQYDVPLF